MEPQQQSEVKPSTQPVSGHSSLHVKEISLALGGLLVGAVAVFCYFLFLAPKPEPVIIEKVAENVALATSTPLASVSSKSNNFIIIDLKNFSTSTLLTEDISTIEAMKEIVKKDKEYIELLQRGKPYYVEFKDVVITPTFSVLSVEYGDVILKVKNYVIDVTNKKVVHKFDGFIRGYGSTQLAEGKFVFGFNSYSYGATSSFPLKGRTLESGLTYDSYYDGQGMLGDFYDTVVVATTSNSITYAVFEEDKSAMSRGTTTMYKKVGERMFIIP